MLHASSDSAVSRDRWNFPSACRRMFKGKNATPRRVPLMSFDLLAKKAEFADLEDPESG